MHNRNPFGFNDLTFVNNVEESKALNDKQGPLIIISADGMCETGRIVHHLYNNIANKANIVLLVGFMADHTLGKRLRDGEKEVPILNERLKVNAEIEQIHAFSAHADYTECVEWLNRVDTSRLKKLYLVHGEPEAQAFFTRYLAENGYDQVEIVRYNETYTV
jgi:metallo-beta-lactamase family protein